MAYEHDHFIDTGRMVWNYSLFSKRDIELFASGMLFTAYEKFGAHPMSLMGTEGYYFAVWAPHASSVSVVGDFNGWKKELHPLFPRLDTSGIWEGFIPRLHKGLLYKFHITASGGWEGLKSDPFAFHSQLRPDTASVLWHFEKEWRDHDWMRNRKTKNAPDAPWSVYEVHPGSWMRPHKGDCNSFYSYTDLANRLIPYVKEMGFTHVEFMPVMEFPFDGSWGYQATGYFSATSRFGTPEEFMELIDRMHQHDIGVILDWVPSHFPGDAHGLYFFDGAHTYEHADPQKGFHPDWNSYIFNYGRGQVVSFLISSAHFWMDTFHADGLRVDAVSSMIHLDFSRKQGEWTPNERGGRENLEAIAFLRRLNTSLYKRFKGIQTIAEEASDTTGITRTVDEQGLGFGMKWMMGWMHDAFHYFKKNPAVRHMAQNIFSFSMMYFYDEKFMMPLSHDEVVHGKSPMIYKMPGSHEDRFANLRLLYSWMYLHPGAKLLFMGNEFGQTSEWNHNAQLDWHLLEFPEHKGLQTCIRDLNRLYRSEPALYERQFDGNGFEWVDLNHRAECVMVFKRLGKKRGDDLLVIINTSSTDYVNWKLSEKGKKKWSTIFNCSAPVYSHLPSLLDTSARITGKKEHSGQQSFLIDIPALSLLVLK